MSTEQAVEYAPPAARNKLRADILSAVQETSTTLNHFLERAHNSMWET